MEMRALEAKNNSEIFSLKSREKVKNNNFKKVIHIDSTYEDIYEM